MEPMAAKCQSMALGFQTVQLTLQLQALLYCLARLKLEMSAPPTRQHKPPKVFALIALLQLPAQLNQLLVQICSSQHPNNRLLIVRQLRLIHT